MPPGPKRFWSAVAAGLFFAASAYAAGSRPPNVLILFTDDQRPDAVAAFGHPALRTPALDSLARSGLAFTNAYCFGANSPAVCLPSRNMLLSGRAYFRWKGPQAPADQATFPAAMKSAGYFTYHHGKKGNSALLIQDQFDINKYLTEDAERKAGQPGQTIVDHAIAFLTNRSDRRPFFMYLAFANPHDPRVAAPEYLDLYTRDQIPLPRNFLPVHPFDNGEMVIRDELLAPWPRTPDEIRRHLHEYYAVITGLDRHIARLLQALKDLGLYDNTIIIFSSDNGLALGSHGLMGKQNLYEHSAKVPLIIAGPGVRPGRSDALVYLMDILPTVLDLVGAPIPAGLDGQTLKPVINGDRTSTRESVFLAYRDCQRAVRDHRWKLIQYPLINRTQLFDLQNDPDELRDLAADSAHGPRIRDLTSKLQSWQRHFGDTVPLTSQDPRDPTFTPPTGPDLDALLNRWNMK